MPCLFIVAIALLKNVNRIKVAGGVILSSVVAVEAVAEFVFPFLTAGVHLVNGAQVLLQIDDF